MNSSIPKFLSDPRQAAALLSSRYSPSHAIEQPHQYDTPSAINSGLICCSQQVLVPMRCCSGRAPCLARTTAHNNVCHDALFLLNPRITLAIEGTSLPYFITCSRCYMWRARLSLWTAEGFCGLKHSDKLCFRHELSRNAQHRSGLPIGHTLQ